MPAIVIDRDKILQELVGVANATWTGVTTWQSVAGGATFPSTLTRRPSKKMKALIVFMRVKYGASVPAAAPKIDFFGALGDNAAMQDIVTSPFATLTMPTPATSVEHQKSLVLTGLENFPYYSWQITNGATNAAEFFVAINEVFITPL
jgi:hypothetical protein